MQNTLVEETLSEESIDRIIKARIALLMKEPYYGLLVSRLVIKPMPLPLRKMMERQFGMTTAATDGRYIYFADDFIESLTDAELLFVLAHEVEHVVYKHALKEYSRSNKEYWNMATDYVNNLNLKDARIGSIPKDEDGEVICLLDERFRGLSSNEVYDILMEEKPPVENPLDFHLIFEGMDGDGNPMSEDQIAELDQEIMDAVIDAVQQATEMGGGGAGNIPGHVKEFVQAQLKPVIDWREYIRRTITSMFRNNYTFMKQSRKSMASNFYLPGMDFDEAAKLSIAIDNSGSISNHDLQAFLSEVYGIMQQFTEFEIKLWFFDTKTGPIKTFTSANLYDIMNIEVTGGGGTDFDCNFEMMKNERIIPETFIMFTDGYPMGSWGDPNWAKETIFLVKGSKNEAPFGTTLFYEDMAA